MKTDARKDFLSPLFPNFLIFLKSVPSRIQVNGRVKVILPNDRAKNQQAKPLKEKIPELIPFTTVPNKADRKVNTSPEYRLNFIMYLYSEKKTPFPTNFIQDLLERNI